MTLFEKRNKVCAYCSTTDCLVCALHNGWCQKNIINNCGEAALDEALTLINSSEVKPLGTNNVNHPSHYNRPDAMECIDEMLMIFGKEMVVNFCICNAWKYRYRAADKNGAEDLNKSDWYMRKAKELINSNE